MVSVLVGRTALPHHRDGLEGKRKPTHRKGTIRPLWKGPSPQGNALRAEAFQLREKMLINLMNQL